MSGQDEEKERVSRLNGWILWMVVGRIYRRLFQGVVLWVARAEVNIGFWLPLIASCDVWDEGKSIRYGRLYGGIGAESFQVFLTSMRRVNARSTGSLYALQHPKDPSVAPSKVLPYGPS